MIDEHASDFAGLPVRDYNPEEPISDPEGTAYRISVEYDAAEAGETITAVLASFLEDPAAPRVRALIIGAWEEVYDQSHSSESIVEALVATADRLPALKALFVGDITYEESEISWIQQSDVTALFDAYPMLEEFRVRGASGLVIGSIQHENLRSLIVESGGLDGAVVRGIASSRLPRLERLELWLGAQEYGNTVTLEDLAPILRGDVFPELTSLGLRDCEGANDIAAAVAQAPILQRLKALDLSLGDLDDEGAKALLASPGIAALETLDIHHHYVSPETVAALKGLGITVDASDAKKPDEHGGEPYRFIAVSE